MTKMTKSSVAAAALLCSVVAFADMEEERQSRTYQSAMADYSAGRMDAAISGFEKAIEANGNNASARFQLACLLQDYKKDWLGAMCSYREYLRLEGRSDKAALARERQAQCERELASELAKKYSLVSSQEHVKTSEQIQKDLGETEKKVAATLKTLDEAQKRMATLERENARLRRQLRMIGDDGYGAVSKGGVISSRDLIEGEDDDAIAPRIPRAAQFESDDESAPRRIDASEAASVLDDGQVAPRGKMDAAAFVPDDDSTGLRKGLADAKNIVEEDESGPELLQDEDHSQTVVRGKLSDFASRGNSEKNENRGDRPATYVVQDGDSLYKIARRFYGKESAWKQIRDANKATISTDGRVKTGQTIVLP